MRIALIAPPWVPVPAPAYGGTEAVVDQLALGLQRAGHEVLLVCHPDSTCPVPTAAVIPVEDTVQMGRGSIELEHVVGAYRLAEGYDIVHDHTLAGPLFALSRPWMNVVTTNHNAFDRTRNAVLGAVLPHVGLVAISHSHAASTSLPVDAVVHHGVDLADFPNGEGGGGYVAILARMAPGKGIDRAVRVAAAAGMPLKIAAKMREPAEREYFDAHVRPHLGGDIEYLGEVGRVEKLELLAGAEALLNPITWREPFGMAMLEAQACGTPVVGCPAGAAPEIVDDGVTGFLRDDDDDLVRALARLDEIDRGACRSRVAKLFNVERMVNGYLDVFRVRLERRAVFDPSFGSQTAAGGNLTAGVRPTVVGAVDA